MAIGLFRGSFTETVPVTVVSDRAGLVMNPDAKVKMRGVEVGRVASIAAKPDGKAVLKLDMNPSQLHLIPSNVGVDITSTTVFGAKYVELVPPKDPSPQKLHGGQVIQGQHVTTEINTVFQQLVTVLDKIDPAKLNETLGAVATAFNGRGEKIGRTLTDFNAFLAKINPSLPNLAHDIEASVPAFSAYGDAAPDLIATVDNSIRLSNSIVEEQQNLDEFLISSIGLADIGNDVIGGNRQALTDVLRVLVPTTSLLGQYHETLGCTIGGLVPFVQAESPQYSHILFNAEPHAGHRALPLARGPAEGRGVHRRPVLLQGTGSARRAHRSSGRRSSSLTPGRTRSSTGIRASCSTPTGSSNGCSVRSRDRPATAR